MKYITFTMLFLLLLTGCRRSFDERLRQQTAEYSRKMCPMQVEPFNTLDSMVYRPDSQTMFYYYTLSDSLDTPQARDLVARNAPLLRANYLRNLANSVELKEVKEHGIGFCAVYRSRSTGRELLRLRLTKRDYAPLGH